MSGIANVDYEDETVEVGQTTLTVGTEIDSGMEGGVFHIKNNNDSVLKIFTPERRDQKEDKVRAMIANDPDHNAIVWPQEVARDPHTGEFLGYKMPYRDLESAKNAFRYSMTELDWSSSDRTHRYTVSYNLAVMVASIHEEGHAIGDFNHDNILIDEAGKILLIDCDGFHITDGSKSFPDDTYYPRYAPPEGRGGNKLANVKAADRFCLGVHIFQFLMQGYHPYQAKGQKAEDGSMEDKLKENKFPYVGYPGFEPIDQAPGIPQYNKEVPERIRKLFKKCFSTSGKNESSGPSQYGNGSTRPNPSEWQEALNEPNKEHSTDTSLEIVDPNPNKDDNSKKKGQSSVNNNKTNHGTKTSDDSGDSDTGNTPKADDIGPITPEHKQNVTDTDRSGDGESDSIEAVTHNSDGSGSTNKSDSQDSNSINAVTPENTGGTKKNNHGDDTESTDTDDYGLSVVRPDSDIKSDEDPENED